MIKYNYRLGFHVLTASGSHEKNPMSKVEIFYSLFRETIMWIHTSANDANLTNIVQQVNNNLQNG